MGVTMNGRSIIRFGEYELDLQAGVLRKNGMRIRCQEQPLQVLAALVERPGELVTREELRRRVWSQDTFVDFDHALNTAIKKIRASLNDDADSPRYVETVPRRGYRFVAQIEPEAQPSVASAGVASAPSNARRTLAAAGIAIFLVAILGFIWKFAPWRGDASTSPEFRRLTFDLPELGPARFTSDGASVVYSAGFSPHPSAIYAQRLGAPGPQQLGIADSTLLAVSPQAELAVLRQGPNSKTGSAHAEGAGTLARVPLNGGAPRDLLPGTDAADWSPSGELAVVRQVGDRTRLEFPIGRVLYESPGWIEAPRFSPSGDAIAFLDHPIFPDDRGSVAIVDLNGNKKTLSGFWESMRGLAWGPQGDEVWFAATRSGVARALYAVTLGGRERRVLSVAGGLSLRDISRDGRILLARDNQRLGILFLGVGDAEPRELSWEDWSMVTDISPDGKRILFGAEGENSGPSYQVGLRPTDGSAPVMLGKGSAQSLSPDGLWAISVMPPPNDQIVLLPTGAGNPKTLERGSVEHYMYPGAKWFPDAKQIVFVGYEAGHGPRCYVQSVEGGKPRAFTPDGMMLCSVSPRGRILAFTEDFRALLYSSQTSEQPEKEFKFEQGEIPGAWTADGKSIYLVRTQNAQANITLFEIASARRTPWKQFSLPPEKAGMKSGEVIMTPDGQSFAYTYSNHSSDLYLLLGVK
ncbi:MAG: winged helix-turn-helix domain-containing protein [Acidobacteriia bacterium]|nr:winged helix-turn-helix domain-containing protein [Terriglobia bacterium]